MLYNQKMFSVLFIYILNFSNRFCVCVCSILAFYCGRIIEMYKRIRLRAKYVNFRCAKRQITHKFYK